MSANIDRAKPSASVIAKLWEERRPLLAEYERLDAALNAAIDGGDTTAEAVHGLAYDAVCNHDDKILAEPAALVADFAMQAGIIIWRSHREDFEGYAANFIENIARAGIPLDDIPLWRVSGEK